MSFRAPVALFAPVAGLTLFAAVGCAHNAEEKQLDAMREEIDNVRQSRDRADQPTGNRKGSADPSMVVPQSYAPAAKPPPPSVVQIGADVPTPDEDDADAADPQDTTPRPSIRIAGSAPQRGRHGGEDRIERTSADDATGSQSPASRATPLDPEAKRAYDAAYALVTGHRYEQALDALAAFLLKWPDHPYANNAMYWRGECYFARGDYQRASEQFDGVLKRYPAGAKAPDALLKLGISQQKLGNTTKAKECFDRLAQQYPGTEAARHIPALRMPTAAPPGPAPEDH
jgi:tol-pal system protein YbgF